MLSISVSWSQICLIKYRGYFNVPENYWVALWKILSLNNNSRSLDNYGIHCFNLAVLTCSEFRNQQGMFSSVSFDLLKVSYGFRSRWNAYNIQKYLVFWLYLLLLCIILLEEQMIRKIRFSDLCIHTGKQVNIYTYVIYTHIYLYISHTNV